MTVVRMEKRHIPSLVALEQACFSEPWTAAGFEEELENPVAVSPACRRQGVAAALLEAALAECAARGVERLCLEVRESNAPAIALYTRFGFALDGRRPRFYSAPTEDALLYSWKRK